MMAMTHPQGHACSIALRIIISLSLLNATRGELVRALVHGIVSPCGTAGARNAAIDVKPVF